MKTSIAVQATTPTTPLGMVTSTVRFAEQNPHTGSWVTEESVITIRIGASDEEINLALTTDARLKARQSTLLRTAIQSELGILPDAPEAGASFDTDTSTPPPVIPGDVSADPGDIDWKTPEQAPTRADTDTIDPEEVVCHVGTATMNQKLKDMELVHLQYFVEAWTPTTDDPRNATLKKAAKAVLERRKVQAAPSAPATATPRRPQRPGRR